MRRRRPLSDSAENWAVRDTAISARARIRKRSVQGQQGDIRSGDHSHAVDRGYYSKVTRKNIESLETSRKLVEPEIIDTCVKMIEESRIIQLFGLGSSLLVARDLY